MISWDSLLYLSMLGMVAAVGAMAVVTGLGIRYRRELPKLPIKEKLEWLVGEREREEANVAELQDKLAQARIDIREGERAQEFLQTAKPEMERLQAAMREALDAKARAELDAGGSQQELDKVLVQVKASVEQRDRLKEEIAPLRMDLAEVQARLERTRDDLRTYQEKREEFARIEAQLPGLRDESERLTRQLDESKQEFRELGQALNGLRTDLATLQGVVEGRKVDQARLDQERERLLQSIEELKRLHSSVGGADEENDSRQDLWVPIFRERHTAGGPSDEQERLNRMEQQLKPTGISFSQRTLYAFHTSLKIQDISPLTVLAGISGTGKSLLPQLYSKCMGLHFLNLPVQPGWNSPQDLFGFYNYIEHRFKATPLARALVQFDQFNRGKWPLPAVNKDLNDQLLLVLLDEMNLARVEYYFSELLSRLEMRRSIGLDSEERKKVEIALEIGHAIRRREGGVEDISVSVHPGENVLFTGTMNEDESTMSLSDKVLDRATVLRFGRPAQTVSEQPNMGELQPSAPIALSTWKRWFERQQLPDEIKDAVAELGEIMAEAGTPYGHRVHQSIEAYISLYPDSTLAGQRMALVDQVEQKILPKLRGRELVPIQNSLQKLARLVGRMDDGELAQAIQQGQNQLEGTFLWIGLDRNRDG